MYGLVNQAVEDLVVSNYGEGQWQAIKNKAGVGIEVFISNEGYADEITYRLVNAATEVLEANSEEADHDVFEVSWISKTA